MHLVLLLVVTVVAVEFKMEKQGYIDIDNSSFQQEEKQK